MWHQNPFSATADGSRQQPPTAVQHEGVRLTLGDRRTVLVNVLRSGESSICSVLVREYDRQSLPITGPESLSFAEVTAKIGAAIGKSLTFQPISDKEARERYSRISGSAEETKAHVALWRAIRDGRLATVTDNVQRILSRKPIAIDQWLLENVEAFR